MSSKMAIERCAEGYLTVQEVVRGQLIVVRLQQNSN